MAVDKYGIYKINATKQNGATWYNEWNNGHQRDLEEGDDDPYDHMHYNCGLSVTLRIDGKGHAYTLARTDSARIFAPYSFPATPGWVNTEMTIYAQPRKEMADIQLRSRSNHEDSCGFGNYLVKWNRIENGAAVNQASVEVEAMHPFYSRNHATATWKAVSDYQWVGYKQVTQTVSGNTVRVRGYSNRRNDKGKSTNWIKDTEFTVTSSNITNINVDPDDPRTTECTGQGDMIPPDYNTHALFLNPGKWCWIRINGTNGSKFKYFSVREIDAA